MKNRRQFLLGCAASGCCVPLGSAFSAEREQAYPSLTEAARSLEQLHAIVVANGQEVLYAKSFRGPKLEQPVNVKSVSKTLVALLTGIAIDKEIIPSTDSRIGDLAPHFIPKDADPAVSRITIADLLTMRAGLERTSGPYYGAWINSPNWISYVLSRPLVAEPGQRFQYSTGSYHILGAILAARNDGSLLETAREWLAEPLGIRLPPWTRDPQGNFMGGNNMEISPLGLVRVGQMVLDKGKWQREAVVPTEWIDASWKPRARSPFSGHEYGYGWFLTRMADQDVAYARGYGGQMLYVAPQKNLTAVVTSDPTRPARSRGYAGDLHRLFAEEILAGQ